MNAPKSAPWVYYGLLLVAVVYGILKITVPLMASDHLVNAVLGSFLTLISAYALFMACAIIYDDWDGWIESINISTKDLPASLQKPFFGSMLLFPFIMLPVYLIGCLIKAAAKQTIELFHVIRNL